VASSASAASAQPAPQASAPPSVPPANLLARACAENISGFERAYKITFFAATLALLFGLLLPGWPAKWVGRGAVETPAMSH